MTPPTRYNDLTGGLVRVSLDYHCHSEGAKPRGNLLALRQTQHIVQEIATPLAGLAMTR